VSPFFVQALPAPACAIYPLRSAHPPAFAGAGFVTAAYWLGAGSFLRRSYAPRIKMSYDSLIEILSSEGQYRSAKGLWFQGRTSHGIAAQFPRIYKAFPWEP